MGDSEWAARLGSAPPCTVLGELPLRVCTRSTVLLIVSATGRRPAGPIFGRSGWHPSDWSDQDHTIVAKRRHGCSNKNYRRRHRRFVSRRAGHNIVAPSVVANVLTGSSISCRRLQHPCCRRVCPLRMLQQNNIAVHGCRHRVPAKKNISGNMRPQRL